MNLEDTKLHAELEARLRFETLIADLSSEFVNLPAGEVDREIEDAQRRVCECLDIDLCGLWQWTEDTPRYISMTHLYRPLGGPRTIQVNVRVIAATHRDLVEDMRKERFREDLYYRLNVFPIRVPPLRERPEDIPALVWAFLEEFSSRMGKKITQVPRKTMEALQRHPWPGNVRELRSSRLLESCRH